MLYEFFCDKCGKTKQFDAPIQKGPPEAVTCECGKQMCREYTTNIVFKGHFPGKDIKRANDLENSDEEIEKFEKKRNDKREEKDFKEEVMKERRKGSEHMRDWRHKNQSKWDRYTKLD